MCALHEAKGHIVDTFLPLLTLFRKQCHVSCFLLVIGPFSSFIVTEMNYLIVYAVYFQLLKQLFMIKVTFKGCLCYLLLNTVIVKGMGLNAMELCVWAADNMNRLFNT